MKYLTIVILILWQNGQEILAQQSEITVKLIIKTKKSDAVIKSGEIYVYPLEETYQVNKSGITPLPLHAGAVYRFKLDIPGFMPYQQEMEVGAGQQYITMVLPDELVLLEEVEVTTGAWQQQYEKPQMSVETISPKTIKQQPVILGEKDVIKAATLSAGVASGSEGSADLIIRGGGTDQNLYLLDNATLYHSNHLYGFLSSYNPLLVSEFNLYKGGFPPRFGNKLSSIVDVHTRLPDSYRFSGEANLGLISSSGYVNVPIINGKLSLLTSGRRSYFDLFMRIAGSRELYNFYDTNNKLLYNINENHQLVLSSYHDRDNYKDKTFNEGNMLRSELTRRWQNSLYHLAYYGKTGNMRHQLDLYNSNFTTTILDVNHTSLDYYENRFSAKVHDYTLKYRGDLDVQDDINVYAGLEVVINIWQISRKGKIIFDLRNNQER